MYGLMVCQTYTSQYKGKMGTKKAPQRCGIRMMSADSNVMVRGQTSPGRTELSVYHEGHCTFDCQFQYVAVCFIILLHSKPSFHLFAYASFI